MNPAGQLCKASLQIKDAFAALRAAKLTLYESSEKAISAKVALDKKRSKLLAGNAITGQECGDQRCPARPGVLAGDGRPRSG